MTNNTPSLATSAMLVELTITQWSGERTDRNATKKVKEEAGACTSAGAFKKRLLPNEPALERLHKLTTAMRAEHYHRTMPWSDRGPRLLTTKSYFDYVAVMSALADEFHNQALPAFFREYNSMVQRAETRLGALFNADDYPDRYTLRNKFRIELFYSDVPTAGDFRVDLPQQALDELNSSLQSGVDRRLKQAYEEVWERTYKVLANMSLRLSSDRDKPIFHDTLVSNVRDMAELLEQFNVTNDPKLARAREGILTALDGVTPDKLRASASLREDTKNAVDALMGEFTW